MTNNFISNETPIVGKLSIISMKGCEGITAKIDEYLRAFRGYEDTETYVTHVTCPRFGTGEGKCVIDETVRGHDVYIICDVFNYGVTYKMYGVENHMSPDDHYQDLKRVIAAMGGKARRVTVVMPMLYEGRQHKRSSRESLDCAMALQELFHRAVGDDPACTRRFAVYGDCRTEYRRRDAIRFRVDCIAQYGIRTPVYGAHYGRGRYGAGLRTVPVRRAGRC